MIREVAVKQERIARARGRQNGVLSSIAILGVVGWSVAVPTLIGVAVGLWVDHHWPSRFSWTLTLLVAGLVFGCAAAWQRVKGDQP
ncbi:MAG: AtpZ/AtpI family protein [Acidobacteriia bacterium]|nr:AtpZ/AtpI family protein [Terriglobia bacterium]